jgi:hypothetical protein
MPTARDTKSASAPPSRSARIVRVSFVGHHLVQCKPDQDLIYSHRPAGSRGHAAGPEAVNRAVPRQERGRRDARLLPSPERLRGSTPASGPRGAHSTAWRMHGLPLSIHPVWLQTPRSGCATETAIKAHNDSATPASLFPALGNPAWCPGHRRAKGEHEESLGALCKLPLS